MRKSDNDIGIPARRSRGELHLAMTASVETALTEILLPPEPRPHERGVIGLLHQSNGSRRRTLLLQSVVRPLPGDVTLDEDGLKFSTAYKSRATDAAATAHAGLIFIHTHPADTRFQRPPRPSKKDLEADARDLYTLGRSLSRGVPLAAGILSDIGTWAIREYSFKFPQTAEQARRREFDFRAARVEPATCVRIVAASLNMIPLAHPGRPSDFDSVAIDRVAQDSSLRIWGERGQKELAMLQVALVGAGGVGSILAEHLARLGVGAMVIVDFDRCSPDVANRTQGATRADGASLRLKVHIAARNARRGATAPKFRVTTASASVVEAETIPLLLDCDVIINAADSAWARQVLDHLAFAHLIPVVNGGTTLSGDPETGRLVAGKSEVSATGPGQPCSECANVYSIREVTEAQESPDVRGRRGYLQTGEAIPDAELRAPSVIGFNALVAGLMEIRFLAIALGTTPDAVRGVQRYHALEGTLQWAAVPACRPECNRQNILALGDDYILPTGRDMDRAYA
jgi:ThiF family